MIGRGDRIRTCDPCLPKAVLYQAELHPDLFSNHQYTNDPFQLQNGLMQLTPLYRPNPSSSPEHE